MTYGQAFLVLLVSAWLIGESMFLWMTGFMHDPTDRIERAMFYHGLSRAIFAPVMVSCFWMFSTAVLLVQLGFVTGRIHRAERSEANGGQ